MKSLSLKILALLLLSTYARSQEAATERLLNLADTSTNVSERIDAYNELAWIFRYNDTDRGLVFADSAIRLSRKIGAIALESTGHARAGEIRMFLGQLPQAQQEYVKSLSLAENVNNQYYIGRAANSLSVIYRRSGDPELAIEYGKKAVSMFNIPDYRAALPVAMDNLGMAFVSGAEYDSAFKYLDKALTLRLPNNDSKELRQSYINLGFLYYATEDYPRALSNNQKALETFDEEEDSLTLARVFENLGNIYYRQGHMNNAEANHLHSLNIRELKVDSIGIANSLHNLALIYENREDYSKSIEYINTALKIYEKRNHQRSSLISAISLGNIYFDLEDREKSLNYLQKAYNLGKELNLLVNFPEVALRLSLIYDGLGQTSEALKYSKEYGQLESEFRKSVNQAIRLELGIVQGRSTEALLAEKQRNSDLLAENNALTITLLAVGIILSALLFVALIAYLKLRQKKVIAEKNERIRHQENEELLKKQELAAMGAMLEGQEEERKRIARDLHDRIGSMLSMVKIHFKSVEDNLEALKVKNREQYERANELLDEACDEVRKVAHDMVSGVLMKFGLVSALKNLCNSVQSTGQLNMELIDFGLDERLDYDYEINIYRIVQEMLSNVLKHAEASEMTIQLLKKDDSIHMIVEDNGKGFKIDSEDFEPGMGLKNIESRVLKLNGDLSIDSGKGAGTTITIDLKLENGKND